MSAKSELDGNFFKEKSISHLVSGVEQPILDGWETEDLSSTLAADSSDCAGITVFSFPIIHLKAILLLRFQGKGKQHVC